MTFFVTFKDCLFIGQRDDDIKKLNYPHLNCNRDLMKMVLKKVGKFPLYCKKCFQILCCNYFNENSKCSVLIIKPETLQHNIQ